MNIEKFAKETIAQILEKMEKARLESNSNQYKTLTNSLRETLKLVDLESSDKIHQIAYYPRDVEYKAFYKFLLIKLNEELKEISKVSKKELNKDDVKSHYNWMLSFNIVKGVLKDIGTTTKLTPTLFTDDDRKIHFVSLTNEKAVREALKKFKDDDKLKATIKYNCFLPKIETHGLSVITYGVSDLHRLPIQTSIDNYSRDNLIISTSVGFSNYVEYLDDVSDKFDSVLIFNINDIN